MDGWSLGRLATQWMKGLDGARGGEEWKEKGEEEGAFSAAEGATEALKRAAPAATTWVAGGAGKRKCGDPETAGGQER